MAQIDSMIEKLKLSGGPVLPNKYTVRLWWDGDYHGQGSLLPLPDPGPYTPFLRGESILLASSVNIPSRSVAAQTYRPFGVSNEMAHSSLFQGDIEISFIETEKTPVRGIFEAWMDNIVNSTTGTVNYYNNYIGDIMITLEKSDGTKVYDIMVREAYPKVVSTVPLSYSSSGNVLQNIIFSFKKYEYLSDDYSSTYGVWPGERGPVFGAQHGSVNSNNPER